MSVTIRTLSTIGDRELDELCDLLIDCVEGGASVSFMLPMTRAKARAFWTAVGASLVRGERALRYIVDSTVISEQTAVTGK